jgi:flagellar hook assembly protein FlgD
LGAADVAVYDLRGRLVRTIVDGDYEAGYQTASWDGRDESGRDVSSGVYFLRATSAGESNQIKLIVVR